MSDIVSFLTAQLDADEAVARAAGGHGWGQMNLGGVALLDEEVPSHPDDAVVIYPDGCVSQVRLDHIIRHDPARVLAEVAAKRAVVAAESRVRAVKPEYAGAHFAYVGEGFVRVDGEALSVREYEERCTEAPEPSLVLRALASVYAGAEGWDPTWGLGTEVGV